MEDLDLLRKLLALALHNPSEEEARSAAMAAVKLIEEKNITLGGERVTMPVREWTKPSQDFEDTWAEMNKKPPITPDSEDECLTCGKPRWFHKHPSNECPNFTEAPTDEFGAGRAIKAPIQDNDVEDDFMRKRVILAWQRIREERVQLRHEIHNANERFRQQRQKDYEPLYKEHK